MSDYFIYLFKFYLFIFHFIKYKYELTYRLGRAFLLTTTWLAISEQFNILISTIINIDNSMLFE